MKSWKFEYLFLSRWLILMGAFFFTACGSLTGRIPEIRSIGDSSDAGNLLSVLEERNNELKAFKGKGRIVFWRNHKKNLVAGAAWIGLEPDRLRIALLSASGQPLVSFSNDGKFIYLLSHTEGRFYKQRSTNSNLKKLVSIPIKSMDMVSMLAGRIPVQKHSFASIDKNRTGDGYTLVLKKRWGRVTEKIYLDENKKDVRKFEIFNNVGALAYRAELYGMKNINGYQIPARLIFSNGDGFAFQLDIDRYWADVSVSPSIFGLAPPE